MKKFKLKINFGWKELILVGVFVLLLATDLLTKYLEEMYRWNFIFIPNLIEVESGYRNGGAAFSMFASVEWGQALLIVSTSIMMLALIFVFLCLPKKFYVLKIAVILVLSGAIGNFIDRIAFGEVRDFVWINMFFTKACCNFADFWIVFGAILLVVDTLFFNDLAVFPLTKKAKQARADKLDETSNVDEKIENESDLNSNSAEVDKNER